MNKIIVTFAVSLIIVSAYAIFNFHEKPLDTTTFDWIEYVAHIRITKDECDAIKKDGYSYPMSDPPDEMITDNMGDGDIITIETYPSYFAVRSCNPDKTDESLKETIYKAKEGVYWYKQRSKP